VEALVSAGPHVRPARAEDLARMAWLEEAAFRDSWPGEMLAHELTHPRALLLVATWAEGQPAAGYVSFRVGVGEAELLRLAVDPAERRRGVARALIETSFDRLRRQGVEACFLEVRQDNEGAIAFYRDLGFARAGRRRGYYRDGTDALIFSLPL
jgi:[ribosomal protein S18]-alanine N-acetyltransferase